MFGAVPEPQNKTSSQDEGVQSDVVLKTVYVEAKMVNKMMID